MGEQRQRDLLGADVWARAADTDGTLAMGPAPRVDSFQAFARVFRDDEGAAWWVPAIGWPFLTGCAAVGAYVLGSAGLPCWQGVAAPFGYVLWGVVGIPGAIAWIWYTLSIIRDLRARPRERREAYDAWQRSGILVRSYPTGHSYRPRGDENPHRIYLLIRPETDPHTAHRLLVSSRDWGGGMDDEATYEVFTGRHVIATEDIFGADARGGFLTDKPTWDNWILLLPPARGVAGWTTFGMSAATARELSE